MSHQPLAIALLAAVSCAACQPAEHGTDAGALDSAAPQTRSELCDGSSGIRLALQRKGNGHFPGPLDFINVRGFQFMIVDGKCHYVVSSGVMAGIAEGDLSDADEAQLRQDIGWANRVAWQGVSYGCEDGDRTLVAANDASFACGCGTCPDAGDKSLVFANVSVVIGAYQQRGKALSGPVRALATQDEITGVTLFSWPLVRPIASIDGLVWTSDGENAAGARFDNPSEQAGLRALRTTARTTANNPIQATFGIGVQEEGVYFVVVRDELPAALDDAFAKFIADALASL